MTSRPNPKAFMYLALGTVVVGGGLCSFEYTKLGDVRGRVSKLRAEVSDPKAVKDRLDQSGMKLEGARRSLMHLEATVSSAAYVPSLLRDLDGFGKQNGIAVTGVRPAPKKPGDDVAKVKVQKPYDELSIQVTGTGTFGAIQNFVSNLPSFPKIVAARMVSIEPARSSNPETKSGLLSMTVQLTAYIFKGDAPDVGSAAPALMPPSRNGITGAPVPNAFEAAPQPAGHGVVRTSGALAPVGKPGFGADPPTTIPPAGKRPAPTAKTALRGAWRVRVEG